MLPGDNNSTKGALLQIARLLHRDNSPDLKPIQLPVEPTPVLPKKLVTSEGACDSTPSSRPPTKHNKVYNPSTSEGESYDYSIKHHITQPNIQNLPVHPGLYANTKLSVKTRSVPITQRKQSK